MRIMKKEKGFTILEVLIAAMLLAIGVVALVASLMTSYGTVSMSQDLSVADRATQVALEHLKGQKDYANLYKRFYTTAYKKYQETYINASQGPFKVLADGGIEWVCIDPASPPTDAVGYGWFEFVVNENAYPDSEWGTSTAYDTTSGGTIDLDGDGYDTAASAITVGRTEGTASNIFGKYIVLPVKVTIRIYDKKATANTGNMVEVVRRTWILNNYEK